MDPFPGADIGNYKLDRKVGEGAFGAVWSGTHRETGDRAALKVLLPTAAASPEQVSRFHREADLLARVRSWNVARMIDFIVDPRFGVVLVMELIDGELLSDLLRATKLEVPETIDLGVQIVSGVRDLHSQGIIHRDLKPNNVMLCTAAPGGSRRVVIFDLGLSRLIQGVKPASPAGRTVTPSFTVLGTLACIAPEQILSARDVTERADLYAVGVILHHALTGRFPFDSADERKLAQEKLTLEAPPFLADASDPLTVGLRDVVARAIRLRPADRYASATAMLTDLERLAAEHEGARRAARAIAPDKESPPRRWKGVLALVIALAALLAAGLAWRARHS